MKYYKYKKKEQLDYMYFKYTYMNLTPKLYSTEQELSQEDFDFTHYISGSDQIWNVNCLDSDDAMFLSFVKKGKKIAKLAKNTKVTRLQKHVKYANGYYWDKVNYQMER